MALFFRESSPQSITIFRLKTLRIVTGYGSKESCRKIFGELDILILYFQYIFLLLCFIIINKDQYIGNLVLHGRNKIYGCNLHPPVYNLAIKKKTHITWVRKF